MSTCLNIHGVTRVEVLAQSAPVYGGGAGRVHWQKLIVFGAENLAIAEVVLFLHQPFAALAIGDCSELDGFQAPALPPPAPAVHRVSQVARF
jgi:hypothetical protein